ncbi:MAG: efflux RND transporter periplasmic adaptor subunit [Bacteroidaceae bacterium]|nr:efflux RND transporter periplasmic adaptor subunit [Bacteroidaceae bacterium]
MKKHDKANLLPALLIVAAVVVLVVLGSLYAFQEETETIQGQADVTEYRVSSKVPGRILEYRVREGDKVHRGDTLALLEAPDIAAKYRQAQAAEAAAAAQDRKALKGARQEQITAAYEMWQKAKAGVEIAEKSYQRVKRLFDQGVTTAQKLDEVSANRDAAVATERAARAQYDMARNGAEREDKEAAAALVRRAQGAVSEVASYLDETVLTASADGEVTEIFPQVGELVGTGAPIMNVAVMTDMWVSFNVREDHLTRFGMHKTLKATVPALGGKTIHLKVFHMKDLGSFAAWKATKTTGQFDMRTFEVKAAPTEPIEGFRPGMSVLLAE